MKEGQPVKRVSGYFDSDESSAEEDNVVDNASDVAIAGLVENA